jgi:hypothetical protein
VPKDPFVSPLPATPTATGATLAATPPPAAPPRQQTTSTTTTPTTTTTSTPPPAQTTTTPAPLGPVTFQTTPAGELVRAAEVRINGHRALVAPEGAFPVKTPLFRLVKLGKKGVHLRLVGGTFADGSQELKLPRGGSIVLVDSTDGRRFTIKFVAMKHVLPTAITVPAPSATTGTAGSPGTSTTPAPSSTG